MKQEKIPITLKEKLSFGAGDFAINGMFTFISSYLLYFYTDSVRISLGNAGIILFTGRIADALASLLIGGIVDRTHIGRDRCKPYIKLFGPLAAALMCLLFFMPDLSDGVKLLWGCLVYAVFSICHSVTNVPYTAMIAVISDRESSRMELNVFKNVGANTGAFFVTFSAAALIAYFGAVPGRGYLGTAVFYAVFFLAAILACVSNTRERVKGENSEKISLRRSAQAVFSNKNWIVFIVIQCAGMLYMIIHNQSIVYFANYYLGNECLSTIFFSLTPIMCVLAAPCMPILVKKIGMKKIMLLGHAMVAFSLVGTWVAGKNIPLVILCAVLTSLGWSIATGIIFVINAQFIDDAERKTGLRLQGFMTSIMTFFMKMGIAAAGYIGPWLLSLGGYEAGSVLSGRALAAVSTNYIFMPATVALVLTGVCAICEMPSSERDVTTV